GEECAELFSEVAPTPNPQPLTPNSGGLMARFVSFVDDRWRERVGLERGGEIFALPVGLTLPVLLSLGAEVVASLAEGALARPAAGRTEELRLLPPVPNPGKILCLAGNYQEHIREGG